MEKYTDMTDEEYDALDELLTKTTPKIKKGTGGVFTENRTRMLLLDEATVRILDAQAKSVNQTPSEFVTRLIRQSITAAL
jgi:alanine dehydrogenase